MDGFEVMSALKGRRWTCRSSPFRAACRAVPATSYPWRSAAALRKPFLIDELDAALRKVLPNLGSR
jgi:hypothetical protein